ncbi:MAG: YIEGIA domain-containing protein [Oscillospiraceae bacterium]
MEILVTIKELGINDIYAISAGIVMGTLARLITLKVDLRQIPSYPSAYFNNIILGLIASSLGAIAIPAILTKDFTAVTFLALAATQFREVRTAERESLEQLEHTEFVQRGEAYIDGISKTFESRNYISLVTAVCTVLVIYIINCPDILLNMIFGVGAGLLVMFLCYRFTKGRNIGEICTINIGQVEVKGSELYVDGIFVTNHLGTDVSRELFTSEGLALVLEAPDTMSSVVLLNSGQSQAILFEAVRALGVKRYRFIERNLLTGKVIIAFVPIINDPDRAVKAAYNTPVLENSRKIKRIMKTSFGGKE